MQCRYEDPNAGQSNKKGALMADKKVTYKLSLKDNDTEIQKHRKSHRIVKSTAQERTANQQRQKKGLNMNGGLITPQETGGSIKKKQPSTGEENQGNRGKARQEIKMTHGT